MIEFLVMTTVLVVLAIALIRLIRRKVKSCIISVAEKSKNCILSVAEENRRRAQDERESI